MRIQIRNGERKDMSDVLNLIKELAIYEKAPDDVLISVEELAVSYTHLTLPTTSRV